MYYRIMLAPQLLYAIPVPCCYVFLFLPCFLNADVRVLMFVTKSIICKFQHLYSYLQ